MEIFFFFSLLVPTLNDVTIPLLDTKFCKYSLKVELSKFVAKAGTAATITKLWSSVALRHPLAFWLGCWIQQEHSPLTSALSQ